MNFESPLACDHLMSSGAATGTTADVDAHAAPQHGSRANRWYFRNHWKADAEPLLGAAVMQSLITVALLGDPKSQDPFLLFRCAPTWTRPRAHRAVAA
jgi:hypothetical protein